MKGNSPLAFRPLLNAIEHWRERAKAAKNLMMRARYADLAWDFGKVLGDTKRDYQCALIAIESYLEAANKRLYPNPIEGVKWIVRAWVDANKTTDSFDPATGERIGPSQFSREAGMVVGANSAIAQLW
jgi:hypothetical protein